MAKKDIDLAGLGEEELLDLRICDLPLTIEASWLADCIQQLYRELDQKGIAFKPPCYLADEWLTPDQEPLVGIPFFLAHPALIKLERKMMLEVEGETKPWCMKLLRHETGHAINYAYKLYKRRNWQKTFGKFDKEYEETYRFRRYSKGFVRHLEDYYAQYHPDEDFAETFAVWLTPELDWSSRYKGWKALHKLLYVDKVMKEIKRKEPVVKRGKKYWQARRMRTTLGNFYKKKRRDYAEEFPDFHDANLKQIFAPGGEGGRPIPACDIIKKYHKDIVRNVSAWTGEKKYIIDNLLKRLAARCRDLKLEARDGEPIILLRISTYVTTLIMNYLHTGWFGGQ